MDFVQIVWVGGEGRGVQLNFCRELHERKKRFPHINYPISTIFISIHCSQAFSYCFPHTATSLLWLSTSVSSSRRKRATTTIGGYRMAWGMRPFSAQFFSFSCSFRQKTYQIVSVRHPWSVPRRLPPPGEILDPPLLTAQCSPCTAPEHYHWIRILGDSVCIARNTGHKYNQRHHTGICNCIATNNWLHFRFLWRHRLPR